jgi:hypothetical protein
VRLEGKCVCYAFVKELERGDKGTDIIRLSKPVRMTIHAGLGDSVMIKKEDMEKICKLEDLE